jgi:hypothetical protein
MLSRKCTSSLEVVGDVQSSSDMPTGDCDMDTNEDPEALLSCLSEKELKTE